MTESPGEWWPLILFAAFAVLSGLMILGERWRSRLRQKQLQALAAAEGVEFRLDDPPILIPEVRYSIFRHTTAEKDFLHGMRRDAEVFSADFRRGWQRSARWRTMVGVHGKLRETSRFDLRRWHISFLNGWTFLIPRRSWGGVLRPAEIVILWDVLTSCSRLPELRYDAAKGKPFSPSPPNGPSRT